MLSLSKEDWEKIKSGDKPLKVALSEALLSDRAVPYGAGESSERGNADLRIGEINALRYIPVEGVLRSLK